jgi:hypothetical protein
VFATEACADVSMKPGFNKERIIAMLEYRPVTLGHSARHSCLNTMVDLNDDRSRHVWRSL